MDNFTVHLPDGYTPDTPVLVAFSGGADSTLLLHLLQKRAKQSGAPLFAVHVHHGIRGKEADRDLDFCRQICKELCVPLFAVKVNVPALARRDGKSLEEAARDARYRHFARLMQQHNIPLLATAHHADDNLETLLFRICRGTGTQGLRGIPAYAPLPGTTEESKLCLFRPLLNLTKQEILNECRKRNLAFVTDATNACNDYARNRIRNRVIPELEQLFTQPQRAATRLCRAVSEDCDALDAVATQLYSEHNQNGSLPINLLRSQPPAITKRLIRLCYTSFALQNGKGNLMPEAVHLDAIYKKLLHASLARISMPGHLTAVLDRDVLRIQEDTLPCAAHPYSIPLCEGTTEIASAGITVWAHFPEKVITDTAFDTNVYNLYTELQVRFDTIKGRVFLRPIQQGDTILHGGMHKKIRKLYGQRAVPLGLRPRLPLLCDEDGVVAVPGICTRDGSAAKEGENALCVSIYLHNHFDT